MEHYNITIFRQSRILLSLFLLPVFFLAAIFIGAEINSFVIPIIFMVLVLFLMYYFVIGKMEIMIDDSGKLVFKWKKKILFNFKRIDPVKIAEIETIVLDDRILLKKIKTNAKVIHINNAKIASNDIELLIRRLKIEAEKYDIEIIDSWDEIAKAGYLKIAYNLSTFILILSILSTVLLTVIKGFYPFSLSVLLLFIPQIILYKKQMREKMK